VGEATEFLYSGETASQTDVAADAIEVETAAVIRGQVKIRDGSGLAAVKISAFGHDEFGYTYTREDGSFDFVLNGGGFFTIVYQKDGYITVQRQAKAEWQDYRWAQDVVMSPGFLPRAHQHPTQTLVEDVLDKRALSRTRHSRDANEGVQRELDVEIL
jgi:hypothetical protein